MFTVRHITNVQILGSSGLGDSRRARRGNRGTGGGLLRNKARALPRLELLEDRILLTTYNVTSTGTANVAGTLLNAINQLDSDGGSSNIIDFNIGSGVQTITPASPGLPTITKPVTIEGTASSGVPQVQILGGPAGSGANGLSFGSGSSGSSVQDLAIAGFASGDGIDITSSSTDDSVLGCWLGINASESADANSNGIDVGASGATIGGTTSGDTNIISGNSSYGVDTEASCLVVGNDIGTNAAGTAAIANRIAGVRVHAPGATIGGTTSGDTNIISGNSNTGVFTLASCLVEGNLIGTNAAGTAALANGDFGISVHASGATIGGTTSGDTNVISGNSKYGVDIDASCLVEGNDIGTNAAGTAAVANRIAGVFMDVPGATIGGTTSGDTNIISGNSKYGVDIDASCLVVGNDIGTNAAGTAALANGESGIYVGVSGATIGGTTSGDTNIISGNSKYGVDVEAPCLVVGNDIGTNAAGTAALANRNDGIYVGALGATVTANSITGGTGGTGIVVEISASAAITNNAITGSDIGVKVGSGAGDTSTATINHNELSGNTTGVVNLTTGTIDATQNWWGDVHGPTTTANPGGDGPLVSGDLSFTPWIGLYTDSTPSGPGFDPTGITLYAVPTKLVFVTEPSSTAEAGDAFARQPVVEAEDSSGHLGINFDSGTVTGSQVAFTLSAGPDAGTLSGTSTVDAVGGYATFSGLSITLHGVYTLTLSALPSNPWSGVITTHVPSTSITVADAPTTPTRTQSVIISEQAIFHHKLNKKGKPTGKPVLTGFTLDYSVPLNSAAASNYQLDTVTTKRVKKQKQTILRPITNFTVSYLAASDEVEITLGATETFPTGGQLTVLGGATTAAGGTLTGNAVFTISKGGKSIGSS